MWNSQKSIKLSLIVTYICIALLLVTLVTLPMLVTWYVEIKGREPSLPTTIMLTCYPCAPFAGIVLMSVRSILVSLLHEKVFTKRNISMIRRISCSALAISVIMLYSGRYYLPFFVFAVCSAFIALIGKTVMDIFKAAMEKYNLNEDDETENKVVEQLNNETAVNE